MTEGEYLAGYDPGAFPALAITVDVVVLAYHDGALHVLLARRSQHPSRGQLALPGVFVGADEALDDAACRAACEKGGMSVAVRQFHTFGAVNRDPRMRIISVGYVAAASAEALASVLNDDHELLRIDGDMVRDASGRRQVLPFDHSDIVAGSLAWLRADLDVSPFSFGLLGETFTLRELQQVHEAVRGEQVNKPAFRKRLLDSGKLVGTGERTVGGKFRPAELYRVNMEAFA